MRSICNAHIALVNTSGAHRVSKAAYDAVSAQLGPAASETAKLDRLIKQRVPDSVDGSPGSFKKGKQDLDAMVRQLGLPSHFITITMNETGLHRSKEYECVDDIMQSWNAAFDWHDAPVECNRAFITRFEHVFHDYIKEGPQILGPVSDYAIRYECQGRGSLHVHMCIWLKSQEAVQALDERIIAYIPADYDDSSQQFVPPLDPVLARLYRHALHKQQHQCRAMSSPGAKGCLRDGRCTRLFPQPLHDSSTPTLRAEKRRYIYRCPRPVDQYTVPFVPELALLTDAHCNVVKVVSEEWSSYLCKYTCKPNPPGTPALTDEHALALALPEADVLSRAIAMRFATMHVFQPAQLALTAMDIPTFRTSRVVTWVNILPPASRLTTARRGAKRTFARPRLDDQAAYETRPHYTLRGTAIGGLTCCDFRKALLVHEKPPVVTLRTSVI
jgi:hypothetical protein